MPAAAEDRDQLVRELFRGDAVPTALEGRFLRTREVALLFQVSDRAVIDWARSGRIPCVKTPGGHRRYPAERVRELLTQNQETAAATAAERDRSEPPQGAHGGGDQR